MIHLAFECMEDCIHLKACRRVQAIGRKHRLIVPRYCTNDCTAYQSGETIIEVADLDGVQEAVNIAVDWIKDGMDYVDVHELEGFSLNDILNMPAKRS